MKIFKIIFKKNEYKIFRKDLGKGYILEDADMIVRFFIFIRNAGKDFDPIRYNYFEHPDWKQFSQFLTECLEFHHKHTKFTTFKGILDGEKDFLSALWDSYSEEERHKIQILAERLDNDNTSKS